MSSTTQQPVIAPVDLAAERAEVGPAYDETALRVLHSGGYVLGPEVEALEKEFAAYQGVAYGVGLASGTDALILPLRAAGVGPGHKVITSPFTFFASAGSIAWSGATPVFVDVDPETALLREDQVAAAVDSDVRAVMPVHLYGQMADVRKLSNLCEERGLFLLEDAAQAHGAERDGVRAGQLGHAAAFSFYPTKNLGAAGDGGMALFNDGERACQTAQLRDHGSVAKYVHGHVGTNSRLHALQAALLRLKLPLLDGWTERRQENARFYDEAFRAHPTIRPLQAVPHGRHVYHQYTVRIEGDAGRRDQVADELRSAGVIAGVHYPKPVHLQEAAKDWGYGPGDFPAAERLSEQVLCLPVHPFLSASDLARVAEALIAAAGQG